MSLSTSSPSTNGEDRGMEPVLSASVDDDREPLVSDETMASELPDEDLEKPKVKRTFKESCKFYCTRKKCVAWFKSVKPSTWIKLAIVLLVVGAVIGLFVGFHKQIQTELNKILTWVGAPFGKNHPEKNQQYFWIAPIILAGVYIIATVLFIPGLLITIGAGFLFKNLTLGPHLHSEVASGIIWGTASVSVGSTLGAAAAFLLGRTIFRKQISKRIEKFAIFNAIDRAIGANGLKLTFLIRLSPVIPFNVINYALGLTRVKFWQYLLASWIGMLPGTILYVYIGTTVSSIIGGNSESLSKKAKLFKLIFTIVGLIVTVGIVVMITWIARKAVKKALAEQDEEDERLASEKEAAEPTPSDPLLGKKTDV